MSQATVVSFEDAMRDRDGGASEQRVVTEEDLLARQTRIHINRCHAALDKVDVTMQLKTQRINVFHNLSVGFPKGRKMVMFGHEGSGRGTIMDILQQRQAPDRGKVHVKSNISWPVGSLAFADPRVTLRDNTLFISHVLGLSTEATIAATLSFLELEPKALKEPFKSLQLIPRRRYGYLIALLCDFDLLLFNGPFKPHTLKLDEERGEELKTRLLSKDYLMSIDSRRLVPENANLAYILYEGRLYHFDDVEEAATIFEALPPPQNAPVSSKGESDDAFDEEDNGEVLF
ncbi:ATP-binding cassette domain-containing protein [Acuticoccus sp. MNP-M23]|uniref:ATP-binding cassette domain-containing protein n=1 Tax=Acuticoccus sp. MNP-M23 TaxID=3072793 RepID=UPI0028169192|nr:ATP-binding cassette domain-containing protein [Acuticoccus sp. MNP-M23]WMS43403.1 ATP-binding cassette domain-containing protein [Acuticoccus sp. MNP-M23]